MSFQWRRTAGHCARISRHAKGSMIATAPTQRMKVNASGETWPAIARPITQLIDQKSTVSVRRR